MAKKAKASFNPEKMASGGGFWDDASVKFTKSKFVMFDYGGQQPEAPFFEATLEDLDGAIETSAQRWKVGGTPEDWEIGEDGDTLVPISKKAKKGINLNSNFGQFCTSLVNAGFDTEVLDESLASNFDGMEARLIRVESKVDVKDEETGKKKKLDVLIVDELLGDEGKAAAKKKGGDDSDDADADAEAIKFLLKVLKDKEGEVTKKSLPRIAMNEIKDDDTRNDVLELVFDDEWLKSRDEFSYKGGVITAK